MNDLAVRIPIGLFAAGAIAFSGARGRLLAPSGAWATFLLGSVVFGLGGLAWSIPLIMFFLPSSLLSLYGRRRVRERYDQVFEKGATRDAGQVWANGGVAGAIVLLHLLLPDDRLFIAYLGSLAAAAADTWGTEVGVLGHGVVVSVARVRRVEPGTSGGVSLTGTLGAVAGALCVAASGAFWTVDPVTTIGMVVIAGVVGMLADSLVGGTLQAGYRCVLCGATTERTMHCDRPTRLEHGLSRVDNDLVNLVCCATGAIVAYAVSVL